MNTNNGTSVVAPQFAALNAEKQISFVRKYDPKIVAEDGYRHAVIRYRDLKNGTAVKPAQMVTLPQVAVPSYIFAQVAPDETDEVKQTAQRACNVLLGVIEDQQDVMIRASIDAGTSVIGWADITAEKCLEALTAARVSERLNKEAIEAWVNAAMLSHLTKRGQEKAQQKNLNAEDTAKQVAATRKTYVENYGKLAAPVPNLDKDTAEIIYSFLKGTGLDDDIAKALNKKLHAILNPVAANNGDL